MRTNRPVFMLSGLALALLGCGGGGEERDPTEVVFGETTLVVVVNPTVNEVTDVAVPPPGEDRSGVGLDLDEGPSAVTGAEGVGVLAPVPAGARELATAGPGAEGSVSLSVVERDLYEVAVATMDSGAEIMSHTRYRFGGAVIDVTPDMGVDAINDALSRSDTIVFFGGGVYEGDFVFSGSNVTLFGEGESGGRVTLDGNVEISGSQNGIRGATVTGDLTVSGSGVNISFTRVLGRLSVSGSDGLLLADELCGAADVSGSGTLALGNQGLAPLPAPPDCP